MVVNLYKKKKKRMIISLFGGFFVFFFLHFYVEISLSRQQRTTTKNRLSFVSRSWMPNSNKSLKLGYGDNIQLLRFLLHPFHIRNRQNVRCQKPLSVGNFKNVAFFADFDLFCLRYLDLVYLQDELAFDCQSHSNTHFQVNLEKLPWCWRDQHS